jgi:uncharacterized OB-fold protein
MPYVPIEKRLFRIDGDTPVLLGSHCPRCRESFFPRRRLCAVCLQPVSDVDLSGKGTLYSYTYVHAPFFGQTRVDSGGYGVGQVDLPERVRIQAVLVGEPGTWRIGMPMKIALEVVDKRGEDDVAIFRFAPAEA